VTIAAAQTSGASIQPSTHGDRRGGLLMKAITLWATSHTKPTSTAHRNPVPSSRGPISDTRIAEYSGILGIASRTLLNTSGAAPTVRWTSALRARSAGARATRTALTTSAVSTSVAATSAYTRADVDSRRLSGMATASSRNGAKVTA